MHIGCLQIQPNQFPGDIQNIYIHTHARTHTHPFNGPFSRTTQVGQYQKGKTNLDFTEARDSEWQWHQLDYMQVCISLQTDNHASTPPLVFTDQMPFLPPNRQCQSTEGNRYPGYIIKTSRRFFTWQAIQYQNAGEVCNVYKWACDDELQPTLITVPSNPLTNLLTTNPRTFLCTVY